MLTKTQLRIMKLFTSKITSRLSLRGVGKELGIHQALTYRASKDLIKNRLIIPSDEKYVLNYKENHQELAYFEHLRSKEFLEKNKTLSLLKEDIITKLAFGYFILLIFGSTVTNLKPNDLDLMLIVEKTDEIEFAEKQLYNITKNYDLKIHYLVISFESAYEMFGLRDNRNVLNEVLNKHLILYGAELFYKILKRGRT